MAVWMGGCWMLVVRIDQWSYPSWTSLSCLSLRENSRLYESKSSKFQLTFWAVQPHFSSGFSCLLCKSMVLSLTHCLFGPCTGLQQLHERSEFKLKFHMKQNTTAHRNIASNGDGSRPPIGQFTSYFGVHQDIGWVLTQFAKDNSSPCPHRVIFLGRLKIFRHPRSGCTWGHVGDQWHNV